MIEVPTKAKFARLDKQEELEARLDEAVDFIQNMVAKIEADDGVLEKHATALGSLETLSRDWALWNNYDRLSNLEDVFLSNPQNGDHLVYDDGVWHTQRGNIVTTTRVTTTYTILETDHVVFCDTDGGAFTVTLPSGVEGASYRIINVGSGGNSLTVDGAGAEKIKGATTHTITDGNDVDIVFNSTEGWW